MVISTTALALLGLIIAVCTTNSIRRDLKSGNVIEEKIMAKQVVLDATDYEPGSGVLYLPILACLFPKCFNQEMKKVKCAYIISENNVRYDISDEVAADKKELVLFYSEKSDIYLGYQ